MILIQSLYWRTDRVLHIAKHRVTPGEVEEALFDDPARKLFNEGPAERNPNETVYICLGRTGAGRYLCAPLIYIGGGEALPITARDMTAPEKRRYKK